MFLKFNFHDYKVILNRNTSQDYRLTKNPDRTIT